MTENQHFEAADESLLEAALSQSFASPPRPSQTTTAEAAFQTPAPEAAPSGSLTSEPLVSSEEIDSWKSEYDSQVDAWRAESAVARDKAEKERERWEAARAKEAKEAPPASDMSGWETLGSKSAPSASASVSDARDLVAGEKQRAGPSQSQVSGDEAAKWDHVTSSLSSSFPSMTFPEHGEEEDASLPPAQKSRQAPLFATLAIFDSSLSTRTRVKALFASLAINLVLPFINGVMLGFGEIFAKNIVLEWWRPGSIATQAGIRGRRRS